MIRLIRELIPANVLTLLISEAILATTCFVAASYMVLEVDPSIFLLYDGGLLRIGLVVLSILAALYFHDLYSDFRVRSKILLLQQALQAIGIAFIIQAIFSYADPDWILPRWLMMLGGAFSLVVLVSWRILYSSVVLQAMGESRILFVGADSLVREIARHHSEHPELGLSVLGYVEDGPEHADPCQHAELLGSVRDLRKIVTQAKPDRIVVGMRERRQRLPVHDLLDLRLSGVRIEEATRAYESTFQRISLHDLRPAQIIFSEAQGTGRGIVLLQQLYSLLIALAGTILFAPLMLLIALAIKISSPGPILFRQERVGLLGAPFVLYKFRSMHADAEAETGAVWASKDDPRVTSLGRWLRRLRLDELPQFFNVLRGEMLIVGPRPERPEFVKTLSERIPFYRQRHCVKPGITGWAQINHKYSESLEDAVKKLEYDLYYIKNLSLALDTYIIFHTLKTMLLSRGAQ